jgi:hypothetical protein
MKPVPGAPVFSCEEREKSGGTAPTVEAFIPEDL